MKFGEDNVKCPTVVRLKPRKHGGGATNEEDGGASYTATTTECKGAQSNPPLNGSGAGANPRLYHFHRSNERDVNVLYIDCLLFIVLKGMYKELE